MTLQYQKFIFAGLAVLLCWLTAGCGEKRPPGMPRLYETILTIVQDNEPLTEANVVVVNEDFSESSWVGGGRTDMSGNVQLLTDGKYKGIPAGKYIVAVSKIEKPDLKIPEKVNTDAEIAEYDKIIREIEKNSFNVVSEKFMDQTTTPLRLEVKKKTDKTFDVSPKVKAKIVVGPSG